MPPQTRSANAWAIRPMELMLVNLRTLLGLIDRDLSQLKRYCETVARCHRYSPFPHNYPVVGRDVQFHAPLPECTRRRS